MLGKYLRYVILIFTFSLSVSALAIDHTESYYEEEIRGLFRKQKWEQGKKLLDEAWDSYGSFSGISEMMGWYLVHKGNWDKARYYLNISLRDDRSNVHARDLLIKVEEMTGHYSAAISHINQQLQYKPYDKNLWLKKIAMYHKQGNSREGDLLLERLQRIYPDDETLKNKVEGLKEEKMVLKYRTGTPDERIEALRYFIEKNPGKEEYYMALTNLLLQQGRSSEAMDVAGNGAATLKSVTLVKKKAGIMVDQGRLTEALAYARGCKVQYKMSSLEKYCNDLEEEVAAQTYNSDPYVMYGKMYERTHSNEALQVLANMSLTRGYLDDALFYTQELRKRHGDTEQLLYREYTINLRLGNEHRAKQLLKRIYALNPRNEDAALYMATIEKAVRDSINQATEQRLLHEAAANAVRQYEEAKLLYSQKGVPDEYKDIVLDKALLLVDSALTYDPKDADYRELRELIKKRQYDRSLKNTIYVEYQWSRPGEIDRLTSNATAQYSRVARNHTTWTGTLNYAGRDTDAEEGTSGGTGVQGIVTYDKILDDIWSYSASLGLATKYFPNVMAKGSVTRQHKRYDWAATLSASYRLIEWRNSLIIIGASASKTLGQFVVDGGVNVDFLSQRVKNANKSGREFHVYIECNARGRFYPVEGNKSHIYVLGSIGNAPSTILLDRALPTTFNHLSTSVGFGGMWQILPNLAIGASGTWYTYYLSEKYKNYFYNTLHATIRF